MTKFRTFATFLSGRLIHQIQKLSALCFQTTLSAVVPRILSALSWGTQCILVDIAAPTTVRHIKSASIITLEVIIHFYCAIQPSRRLFSWSVDVRWRSSRVYDTTDWLNSCASCTSSTGGARVYPPFRNSRGKTKDDNKNDDCCILNWGFLEGVQAFLC